MNHIMARNKVDHVTGFAARDQSYHNVMVLPGVKNPLKAWTKAPDYYRAGAAAAFTYGLQGTPDDIIPNHHIVAYNAGKGAYNDADLQAIVDIIIAHVQPSV